MAPEQVLHGHDLINALIRAGVLDEFAKRVVFDCPVDGLVTMYVERYGDRRIIQVLGNVLTAAHIVEAEPEEGL